MVDCGLANNAYQCQQQLTGENKPLISILIMNSFSTTAVELKGNQKLGNGVWV